ncbi:MAG: hypothetical protein OHK0046_48630 [Anaerolineae bacterium]
MDIQPGDVFWVQPEGAADEVSRIAHPHVVVAVQAAMQTDDSEVMTVTMCAITTNMKKISMPGNVLLQAGEANLPRTSVVEVSKVITLTIAQLGDAIGTLSPQRLQQILSGMRFVQTSFFNR